MSEEQTLESDFSVKLCFISNFFECKFFNHVVSTFPFQGIFFINFFVVFQLLPHAKSSQANARKSNASFLSPYDCKSQTGEFFKLGSPGLASSDLEHIVNLHVP